jgi:hypothetical protein
MSLYRGHLLGGLASYLLVIAVWGVYTSVFQHYMPGLIAALAGSLFPDIDISSKGQRLFLKVLFLLIVCCFLMQASLPLMLLLAFSVFPIVLPHRGLFHDLIFVGILTITIASSLIYVMPHNTEVILGVAFFFFVGVLSHLVLDKGFKKTFYGNNSKKPVKPRSF